MVGAVSGRCLRLEFLKGSFVSVICWVGGHGGHTKSIIFTQADQTESHGQHASMYEDCDGIVGGFELWSVPRALWKAGINVPEHCGSAEWKSCHGFLRWRFSEFGSGGAVVASYVELCVGWRLKCVSAKPRIVG